MDSSLLVAVIAEAEAGVVAETASSAVAAVEGEVSGAEMASSVVVVVEGSAVAGEEVKEVSSVAVVVAAEDRGATGRLGRKMRALSGFCEKGMGDGENGREEDDITAFGEAPARSEPGVAADGS